MVVIFSLGLKSGNLEVISFGLLDINQFTLAPESKFGEAIIQRINADLDPISLRNIIELHNKAVNGYTPVSIHCSGKSETEYIFDRLIGRSYIKLSEERLPLF